MDSFARYTKLPIDAIEGRSLLGVSIEDMGFETFVDDIMDDTSRWNAVSAGELSVKQQLARAGHKTHEEVDAYLSKGFELATQLRHAAVIHADRAADWIVNCVLIDPARLHWHIRRLNGVAPSSAGAYVSESRGGRSAWTTARELDLTRLMRRLPTASTWQTFRGTHLEGVNRSLLYRFHADQLEHDAEGLEALRSFRGSNRHPWLGGNPDDLAFSKKPTGRHRVLVDEKCPSEPKDEFAPILLDYNVQLHMYALVSQERQRPVSELALSHLYVDEGLAKLWASMISANPGNEALVFKQALFAHGLKQGLVEHTLQIFPVDRVLQEEIIEVCSAADARVMRGEIAPWPVRPMVALSPDQLEAATRIGRLLAVAIPTHSTMGDRIDALKASLRDVLDGADIAGARLPLPALGVTETRKLRAAEAVERLAAMGLDTQAMAREKTLVEYNGDAIKAALQEVGLPLDEVSDLTMNVGLSRARKGAAFEAKAAAIERGERAAEWLLDALREQTQEPGLAGVDATAPQVTAPAM